MNLCRVVEYDYSAVNTNSTSVRRIEKLLGHEISRQYTLNYGSETRTIQCQSAGAAWNAADNLVTITRYYTNYIASYTNAITNSFVGSK